jgi:D-alanyl-D-alanine dipeptidase
LKNLFSTFVISIIFCAAINAQSDTSIVPLALIDSTIVQDVRYATTNNFTGKVLYPTSKVYLRKAAAEKLSSANKFLKEKYNYRIKIFDGYRPLSVQKKLWEMVPDERYVADPAKGSRHNRGAAVDITIIDSTGNELEMGTGYDDFTEKAHPFYQNISSAAKHNRNLLREIMISFGFEPFETEWWHFDFKGWENFSIQDFQIN